MRSFIFYLSLDKLLIRVFTHFLTINGFKQNLIKELFYFKEYLKSNE